MNKLYDELIVEIFKRVPTPSFISLVCKKWLYLRRISLSSLTIRLPPSHHPDFHFFTIYLDNLLSLHPSLSTLTIVKAPTDECTPSVVPVETSLVDQLYLYYASQCNELQHLQLLSGPVSPFALVSLASSIYRQLVSLKVFFICPLSFRWLIFFPNLKELSIEDCTGICIDDLVTGELEPSELPLDSLCLSRIGVGDCGFSWLWKRCTKLRKLKLLNCQGTGDNPSLNSFIMCLQGLQELELRLYTRIFQDWFLFQMLEKHCKSLNSLLLFRNGYQRGFHRFVKNCSSSPKMLDLYLPLDFNNYHLAAMANNFRDLVTLRLRGCHLVTGVGLKLLTVALGSQLEELALITCLAIENEPGLLEALGKKMGGLRKLDLSWNENLPDKELVPLFEYCKNLIDIKLQGCNELTKSTIVSISKNCGRLVSLDIKYCGGIQAGAVEFFVLTCPSSFRWIHVEEENVTDVAKTWASENFIELVDDDELDAYII